MLMIVATLVGLAAIIAARVVRESRREKERYSTLRRVGRYENVVEAEAREAAEAHQNVVAAAKKKKKRKRKEPTVDELLFMAGRLSKSERDAFQKKRILAPIIYGAAGLALGLLDGTSANMLLFSGGGVLAGLMLPMKKLRGWVKQQHEELSYYLPLMIEQISIGVSSSLDIGPCISQLVEMADERNSHNATIDLLKYALSLVKSGSSLDEALIEIGRASGQHDFNQALISLAQVTKFGGEVSRQLQELADTISSQRDAKIEATIRQLELKATGPVSLVFLAFVALLGLGIAAQIMTGGES